MKKLGVLLSSMFVLFGCTTFDSGNDEEIVSIIDKKQSSIPVDYAVAQEHLKACTRFEVQTWDLKDSSFDGSQGVSIPMDENLQDEDFSVDFDFSMDSDSSEGGLASAGVLGSGAGWILRLENGKVVLLVRSKFGASWFKVIAGKSVDADSWNNIRLDHVDSLLAVSINDEMVLAIELDWDFSKMDGDLTIGFDVQNGRDTSYFCGKFGKFGFHQMHKKDHGDELQNEEPSESYDSSEDSVMSSVASWIAKWEFDDSTNVGRDFSGNGHQASVYEGEISIEDSVAIFDGNSGLRIDSISGMKLSQFVIETRVFAKEFARFNNILVTEPPGYGPDGWILRFENEKLVFLARDDKWDCDWKRLTYSDVELNSWYDIRVEVRTNLVKMFVDGKLVAIEAWHGDYSDLQYQWGIGYDAVDQGIHNRYFNGYIDFIRLGSLEENRHVEPSETDSLDENVLDEDFGADSLDTVLQDVVGDSL